MIYKATELKCDSRNKAFISSQACGAGITNKNIKLYIEVFQEGPWEWYLKYIKKNVSDMLTLFN